MRYFNVELKRAILSPTFLFAVLGFAAILVYYNAESIKELVNQLKYTSDFDMIKITTSAIRSETTLFAIPILATIPFSCGIIDDLSSHFIKELLTRVSKRHYAIVKTLAVAVSAGLTAVLGFLMYTVSIYFIFSIIDTAPIIERAYIISIIKQCGIYFAFFAMWGVLGAICGMLTDSKCVVYCAPFILYYILIIVKSRYLHTVDIIDPRLWSSSTIGVIIIVSLAVLICVGSVVTIRRHIENV